MKGRCKVSHSLVKSLPTKPSVPPSLSSEDTQASPASDEEHTKRWAKETKRLVKTMLGKALLSGHEPAYPVAIKWVKMDEEEWGDASLKNYKAGTTFLVRLNRSLLGPHIHSRDLALFVFIHELAHCLAWAANEAAEESRTRVHGDHGAIWSAEHGALWESLMD